MSAFLGPIHHWVFRKVKFQNEVTDQLIDFARHKNRDTAPMLAEKYGELEEAPLEDIIDRLNIHGWLQERVSLVEYRLAAAVKAILDNGIAEEDELRKLFYDIGASMKQAALPSASAAYELLNDLLLDGMPCDGANELLSEDDGKVVWRRNICVHSPYWKEAGVDIAVYYVIRESMIEGLLDGSDYEFAKQGEEYSIKGR